MKQPTIYINARFLTQPISGVQRFAIELSKELKKSKIPVEFVTPSNIIHKELAEYLEAKTIGWGLLKGHLWEQIILQFYILRKNKLLISFCNTAPIFVKKQIVTIHDLAFRVKPEWFSKLFSLTYNLMIPLIAKKAKHVLTVSSTSKKEIVEELNLDEEKITVIYNGISSVFLEKVENSFIRSKNYILTVSSHHPRKNFNNLTQAFKLIEEQDLNLYVIGNFNKHFSGSIQYFEMDNRIIFLENISDKELANYYKNARMFVYPSVYEGFGIPIIEAMSQCLQVCVSNIEVFKEVCGEKAIYFDPYDINDIKAKILQGLNTKLKPEYNLEKYSWNKSFKKLEKCILAIQDINSK